MIVTGPPSGSLTLLERPYYRVDPAVITKGLKAGLIVGGKLITFIMKVKGPATLTSSVIYTSTLNVDYASDNVGLITRLPPVNTE